MRPSKSDGKPKLSFNMGRSLYNDLLCRSDLLPEIYRGRNERTKTYHDLLAVSEKYKSLLEEWEANQGAKGRMKFKDVFRNGLEFVVAQRMSDVNKRIDAKIEELQGLGKVTKFLNLLWHL